MTSLVKILLVILLAITFMFGVTFGHYKYAPFNLLVQLKQFLVPGSLFLDGDMQKFSGCSLPVASQVFENSHAFIGHAYGSPAKAKDAAFIAPSVLDFIQKHHHQLSSVSFTGDVFFVPSLSKWKRLREEINEHQKVLIAPGNHDTQRPDSRDVFDLSVFGSRGYPFVEYLGDLPTLYDDSVSSKWAFSDEALTLVNELDSQTVIIARHNMPVSDFAALANSFAGMSPELQQIEALVQLFSEEVNYVWVLGDSGAYQALPRLSCLRYLNHTFIINGVGDVDGDSVVLLYNGEFYQYHL